MMEVRTGFWGKLKKSGEVVYTLPLIDHCADVAACCEGLLGQDLIRRRLARLSGLRDLGLVQVQRLCVFAGLHDFGKFNHGFQNKATDPRASAGHIKEALHLFQSDLGIKLGHALDFESMSGWASERDTVFGLLFASICHHGKPYRAEPDGLFNRFWVPSNNKDPFEGIAELVAALKTWFQAAWEAGPPLPGATAFQHAFNGLVVLSDWLASDPRSFPICTESQHLGSDARMETARERTKSLLMEIGLNTAKSRKHLTEFSPRFIDIFGKPPRDIQGRIELLPASPDGSLTIMEAPTGAGKTEAAVARYLALFKAGLVDGLYFALPTRTAATQIYDRIWRDIAQAFPDQTARPAVTLAVPGYLSVDGVEGQRLPNFEVLWEDDPEMKRRYRGWASENSKRYLAGSIVIGTVDQVILSRLAVSHSHLRAAALLRHLLVIDEVHASDTYMTRITAEVLKYHLRAGGHALLMSATLGGEVRERLLWPDRPRREPPALAVCEAETFPLIVHRNMDSNEVIRIAPEAPRSITVRAELRDAMLDPQRVAHDALDAAKRGARVLVVRNTVKDCLKTQASLESLAGGDLDLLFGCEGSPAPHHARFSRDDRISLDKSIESNFGISRPSGGMVAVATQTVQQSLDLDADLLISDLCPMDVLLQRVGRLHRHNNKRPTGFETPLVVVLVPRERDLGPHINHEGKVRGPCGIGSIYEDLCILEATWRLLSGMPGFSIPAHSRALVEGSLHSGLLDELAKSLGESWEEHRNHIKGTWFARNRQAALNLADWEVPFGDQLFPTGEHIATRLGEGDRWIRFEKAFTGPFGKEISMLTLPAHQARGLPDDVVPAGIYIGAGQTRFTLGDKKFIYDRLGLRTAEMDKILRGDIVEILPQEEEDDEI